MAQVGKVMVSEAYISPSATVPRWRRERSPAMHGGLANLQQRPSIAMGDWNARNKLRDRKTSPRRRFLVSWMNKHGWKPHWLDGNTCITYNGMSNIDLFLSKAIPVGEVVSLRPDYGMETCSISQLLHMCQFVHQRYATEI